MLGAGEKMMAYEFDGYWKDVGTVQSLWEANMDLLGKDSALNLNDEAWRIYSRNASRAPQFVGEDAQITNSFITEGCCIHGKVENCVLGGGVKIARGATVRGCVIMDDVVIGEGACVDYSILDKDVSVGAGATVGKPKESSQGITVLGAGVRVPDGHVIGDNEMIAAL